MNSIQKKQRVVRCAGQCQAPEWWATLPEGERAVIKAMADMLRSAKQSGLKEVALAAAKWESGIGFYVKLRLMNERRRPTPSQGWIKVEGRKCD
jgi:hypothetical protein